MPRVPVHSAVSASDGNLRLLDFLQPSGVQRIYVHDSAALGLDALNTSRGASINLHAERAVLLAQPGDVVALDADPDLCYRQFLEGIGIGPSRDDLLVLTAEPGSAGAMPRHLLDKLGEATVLGALAERLDPSREVRISPYYASESVFRLAAALERLTGCRVRVDGGSAGAVALSNRKDLVRDQALRLGVPWSEGELVPGVNGHDTGIDPVTAFVAAIHRVRPITGDVFVRGVWSTLGVDNLRVPGGAIDRAGLADWLRARPAQHAFLVEPLLPVCASPNVQMWIEDDGSVHLLAITAQRLTPSLVHQGNQYPHRSRLTNRIETSALAIARWLSTAGYTGPLGLDFLETRDPRTGAEIALLVEVNGRINGATYVLAVVERLDQRRRETSHEPLGHWRSTTDVPTRLRSFDGLAEALGDLLYSDGRSAGVIPYNVGMLPHGSAYLLMVGSSCDELDSLEQAVCARVRGH